MRPWGHKGVSTNDMYSYVDFKLLTSKGSP